MKCAEITKCVGTIFIMCFIDKKLHYSKFKSFMLASSFGLISRFLYNATGLIATYKDFRLKSTFEKKHTCAKQKVFHF